jgi:hypothetical protein
LYLSIFPNPTSKLYTIYNIITRQFLIEYASHVSFI